MSITLEDLKEKLAHTFDECELIDHLDLTAEDLVQILETRIEERYDYLVGELEQFYEQDMLDDNYED